MVAFKSAFIAGLVASASASVLVGRTTADVRASIATISTDTDKLTASLNAFPATGGSVAAALAINTDAQNLNKAIQAGTTAAKNTGKVSDADAKLVIGDINKLVPKIQAAITAVINKKSAIQGIALAGAGCIVQADLKQLQNSTIAFEAALIADTPSAELSQANSLKASIDAQFVKGVNAYTPCK